MNAFKLSLLFFITLCHLESTGQISELEKEDTSIYTIVESFPIFPGGRDSLRAYVKNKTIYPEAYRKYGYEEWLLVKFVVEKDGSVSNAQLLQGGYREFEKAALNLVENMPKWTSARQGDRILRCYITIPVKFCPEGCAGW